MSLNNRNTRWLSELDRFLMCSLLCFMAVVTFAGVVARYVFQHSFAHIGELVPHLFVWVTFLGIAVAEKEDAHLGVSLFAAPPPFLKKMMHAVRISGKGIFFSTLVVYGFRMSYHSFMRGEMTPFGIPAWSFTLAVPVGGLLILTRLALSEILRGDS